MFHNTRVLLGMLILLFSFFVSSCTGLGPMATLKDEGAGLLYVPAATFEMGDAMGDPDETNVRTITLGGFWLGRYEVSVKDFEAFRNKTEAARVAELGGLPASNVTWFDAVAYCNWLSQNRGLEEAYVIAEDGSVYWNRRANGYRLPTEAEWEWAGLAAGADQYVQYAGSRTPREVGWFNLNSEGLKARGLKKANGLGFYDMSGNVWEWCYDSYNHYDTSVSDNPVADEDKDFRVLRGGSVRANDTSMRVRNRYYANNFEVLPDVGFRLARNALEGDELAWKALQPVKKKASGSDANKARFTEVPSKDAKYRQVSLPAEDRARDLLSYMTLEEKVGQVTQLALYTLGRDDQVSKNFLGSVLSGGGDIPGAHGFADLRARVEELQNEALKTRLAIPIIYGIDAVHGHNNIVGAVIYPHNIGLGAGNNPALVEKIGTAVRYDLLRTAVHWNFAPGLMLPWDERWGRYYEGFAESPDIVASLGAAYIRGLEGPGDLPLVAATAKHYLGDGATNAGKDRGDATVSEQRIRSELLPPYKAAVDVGTETVMISFSSLNEVPMHINQKYIEDVLRGELGFKGLVVSDWGAWKLLPGKADSQIASVVNAGIDMMMVPDSAGRGLYTKVLAELVQAGEVPLKRLDEAVYRVLRLKFRLGLFEKAIPDALGVDQEIALQKEAKALARQAAAESVVILKNENKVLPIARSGIKSLILDGPGLDDTAMQCGGWTIEWQGAPGRVAGATSLGEALREEARKAGIKVFDASAPKADLAVVVIGEYPYAEYEGDRQDLNRPSKEHDLVKKYKAAGIPVVLVLLTGRPVILGDLADNATAVAAAWWPGSEGAGVVDVLWGNVSPRGKLAFTWPKTMDQIPIQAGDGKDALYAFGHGLSW